MSYRPITDVWILARPKVPYYGAYPAGFLNRARALLGVRPHEAVLHVCGGRVRDYPFRGLGPNDKTVDLDIRLNPDYVMDVRHDLPVFAPAKNGQPPLLWTAILADAPYTENDAAHYATGAESYPEPGPLLKLCLDHVEPGHRVGFLHYEWPRPPDPQRVRCVALIGVITGYSNRMRAFSVFERPLP